MHPVIMPEEQIIIKEIMLSERSKHFDPQVIDAFHATTANFDRTRKQW